MLPRSYANDTGRLKYQLGTAHIYPFKGWKLTLQRLYQWMRGSHHDEMTQVFGGHF
jgi:hypothetical protein